MTEVKNDQSAVKDDADKGKSTEIKKDETTAGEALKEQPKQPKMVPESQLLALKGTLEKQINSLKDQITQGATKDDVEEAREAMKKKWPENTEFIDSVIDTIKKTKSTGKPVKKDEPTDSDEESDEDKEKDSETKKAEETRVNALIDEHYTKTLAAMPEYKILVTKSAFKALVSAPENTHKSFAKIVEDNYGHLVEGKGSIDKANSGNGGEPADIDFNKAAKDQTYLKEILSDPKTKAEYNKGLLSRLKL